MERFSLVSVRIKNLNPKVVLILMIIALKSSSFSDNLCKKPPATLDELRAKVFKFIQMEKMTKGKEKVRVEPSRKPMKREVKIKSDQNQGKSRADRPPRSKFSHYTLLIESRRRVGEEACITKLI